MRFLFTFRQSVDAWRKFANCASIVIMLRKNRNGWLQEYLFHNLFEKQSPKPKLETCECETCFCEKMKVTLIPPGTPSRRLLQVGNPWPTCKSISSKCIQSDMNCIVKNTSLQLTAQALTDEPE